MTSPFKTLSVHDLEFLRSQGNLFPIVVELSADTETPVSLFQKITQGKPGSILLESIAGPEKRARYSFILTEPSETLTDLHPIEEKLKSLKTIRLPHLPIFTGGYVGHINYETAMEQEPSLKLPGQSQIQFGRYDTVIVFDHFQSKILLITQLDLDRSIPQELQKAETILHDLKERCRENESSLTPLEKSDKKIVPQSNRTEAEFLASVAKAKEAIRNGEVFQLVLSQTFSAPYTEDPFTLYRALRMINPSPYMFYLNLGDRQIVGASPESLVRLEEGELTIAPIAGTIPRGDTPGKDEQNEASLQSDPKELAEHRMLLDLGRHDVGRVSEIGSVHLKNAERIERFSHVMHLVSDVCGTLRAGLTAIDAFKSCFPAGTLTGAPKIRAMQLIAELETTSRDIYGGGIGYFGFSGNMDFAIAIRTFVVENGTASLQVGAGIIHDSIPEKEFQETLHKAAANFQALNYIPYA